MRNYLYVLLLGLSVISCERTMMKEKDTQRTTYSAPEVMQSSEPEIIYTAVDATPRWYGSGWYNGHWFADEWRYNNWHHRRGRFWHHHHHHERYHRHGHHAHGHHHGHHGKK